MSHSPTYGARVPFFRFYEAAVEGRSLRSSGGLQEEEEEESGEEEPEEGKDYSWKKTIMIGPSYQVAMYRYREVGTGTYSTANSVVL